MTQVPIALQTVQVAFSSGKRLCSSDDVPTPRSICEWRNGKKEAQKEEEEDKSEDVDGDSKGRKEQRELVQGCLAQLENVGTETYPRYVAIDASWWEQWKRWTRLDPEHQHDQGRCERPGEIKNASLIEKGPNMNDMIQGKDYVWIPVEAWQVLKHFYTYDVEPVQRALNTRAGRRNRQTKTKSRSSSIFEDYDLPETPKHWDLSWPHFDKQVLETSKCCWVCLRKHALKLCSKCHVARYCGSSCQAEHWRFHKALCGKTELLRRPNFIARGKVGLSNMGNTCYMNSTLQCLSHCWPLTRYFLSGQFKQDKNKESKLGTGARFAVVWENLLREVYFGNSKTITPTAMKRAIGTLPGSAGQFAGFMQHDAQELLIFILDTLHEDLNLVKVKKYFAEGEDQVTSQKTVANLAAESWSRHMQREHSMISHLFQGQLHNSVVCPNCKFCSHTFSPFLSIPLSLPVGGNRTVLVTVMRTFWDETSESLKMSQIRYAVSVHPNAKCRSFKSRLAGLSGIPVGSQWLVEIRERLIVEEFFDKDPVLRLCEAGALYVFERYSPDLLLKSPRLEQERASLGVALPQASTTSELERRSLIVFHRLTLTSVDDPTYKKSGIVGTPLVAHFLSSHSFLEMRIGLLRILKLMSSGVDILASQSTVPVKQIVQEAGNLRLFCTDYRGQDVSLIEEEDEEETDDRTVELKEDPEEERNSCLFPSDASMTWNTGPIRISTNDLFPTAYEWTAFGPVKPTVAEEDVKKNAVPEGRGKKKGKAKHNKASTSPCLTPISFVEDPSFRASDDASARMQMERLNRNQDDGYSLHECINFFSNMEQLSVGNQWKCPKCLENQQAFKKLSIVRLPDVLIFSIKRFSGTRKLSAFVDFPFEGLDMAPYIAEFGGDLEHEDTVFDLFAVTNHYGSTGGFGHYTAHVAIPSSTQRPQSEDDRGVGPVTWYEFDDSRVTPIAREAVLTSAAYVLYYKRRRSNLTT